MSQYKLRPRFKNVPLIVGSKGKTVRNISFLYEKKGTPEEDHHVLVLYTDDTYAIVYKKKGDRLVQGGIAVPDLTYDMFIGESELQNYLFEPVETEEEEKQRRALEHLQLAASQLGYKLTKR